MLYRLEIENFYSVRYLQVLDLRVADNVPDAPGRLDSVFDGASERAPRVIAIFGANASGKTTVLKALGFIAWFIRASFQRQPDTGLPCERFNSPDCADQPIRLAIEFGSSAIREPQSAIDLEIGTWRYELALQPRASGMPIVSSEALLRKTGGKGRWVRAFERNGRAIKTSGAFNLSSSLAKAVEHSLRDNVSFVATLAQFNHELAMSFSRQASLIFGNVVIDRLEFHDREATEYYALNDDARQAVNREIKRIDLGIKQMVIEPGAGGPIAMFEHEGLEHLMPLYMQSHGTRSFLKLFPFLRMALDTGGMVLLDEIDIAIHPIVLPEIVRWFHDPIRNPRSAQLWMTCHAVSLLEELSKEEIYFTEKDNSGRTSLYGLKDIKDVRRVDNYYRKYLSGDFGAVPQIG